MNSLPAGSIAILTSYRTRFMTNNILYVRATGYFIRLSSTKEQLSDHSLFSSPCFSIQLPVSSANRLSLLVWYELNENGDNTTY